MRNNRLPRRYLPVALGLLAVLVPLCLCLVPSFGQQIHRNGFEGHHPVWVKDRADVKFDETAHAMNDQGAHDGQRCEYIQINAQQGSYAYYQYRTGKAPITEELSISLWAKSNRPGVQLLARVVLPHERNPSSLDDRLTTLVRGDVYRFAGGWKRLEIGRIVSLAREQQQLMQKQLGRAVNFNDAYIDALFLNVYGGPGTTDVWIDDLEMGPVLDDGPFRPVSRPSDPPEFKFPPSAPRTSTRAVMVKFEHQQLQIGDKKFFFRGIRHTDTPVRVLRDAGFNTIWFDYRTTPSLVQQAVDLGFWVVPTLPVTSSADQLMTAENVARAINRFPEGDAVLFWDLGGALAYEQTALVSRSVKFVDAADRGRPVGADVWDGLWPYSNSLNLLGVHRWPLMTTLGFPQYRVWLEQRRRLASPDTFLWTWIQTHMPDWFTNLLYERESSVAGFEEPIGPQPEQIRLLTYTAVGAGCRGLGFWSDRFLADSHQGRDRLLSLALLNQELEMLDPLLVSATGAPSWITTSMPEVQAAVMRVEKDAGHGAALLVLPMWQGYGAQFVPGQGAGHRLTMIVPQVPGGMQAWEVTPGDVRGLHQERVMGGTKVTVPEFGLTTAIVFTADINMVIRFQEQARSRRQLAAQWTYDLAVKELEKALAVEEQLEKAKHTLPDGAALLKDVQDRLKVCKEHWDNKLYGEAYHEGQRAMRPLRILMWAQWVQATKELDSPVSSPYAVSFFTLPRHWQFWDQVRNAKAGVNALPGGDFEVVPGRVQASWVPQDDQPLDEVELFADRVSEVRVEPLKTGDKLKRELPIEGRQCLKLEIKPKSKDLVPKALERTFLAINSPVVRLQPGTLVKISAWVRIPKSITASPDGALFYDSIGGEPLAVRLLDPTLWKQFKLYRRVPASGTVNVTLALTGLGAVYFDDVRIEPLTPGIAPGGDNSVPPANIVLRPTSGTR